MNLEEAIKKVNHYWYTGMDGYFTDVEFFELDWAINEASRIIDEMVGDSDGRG